MKTAQFVKKIQSAASEEEVKSLYVRWLGLDLKARNKIDCVTKHVFWEFKYNVDMMKPEIRAKVVAQALYYVKREMERPSLEVLPSWVICADKNEALCISLDRVTNVVSATDVNWACQPSSPDPVLIRRLVPYMDSVVVYKMTTESEADVFRAEVHRILNDEKSVRICRQITGENFVDVFELWKSEIGQYFRNHETSFHSIFLKDLSGDATHVQFNKSTGDLQIVFDSAKPIRTKVPPFVYARFWSLWQRPPSQKEYNRIVRSIDCVKETQFRRITGSFFTPLSVVRLQMYYMRKILGDDFESKYYIWDPACGTANLVYEFSTCENTFLSTIDDGEIEIVKQYALAPGAEVFKYDFLNDDVDLLEQNVSYSDPRWNKLPDRLRYVLQHEPEKLIILMNPPFGQNTSVAIFGSENRRKYAASHDTKLGHLMKRNKILANNLAKQFLFRAMLCSRMVFSYGLLNFIYGKQKISFVNDFSRLHGLFAVRGRVFSSINDNMPIIFFMLSK